MCIFMGFEDHDQQISWNQTVYTLLNLPLFFMSNVVISWIVVQFDEN